jgi:hypothetical protein
MKIYWIGIFQDHFSKLVSISKPSWKLRGQFHSGGLYLVKGKAFEIGGGISNLENASYNLIHIPLTICKRTLKWFSKRFAKTKTSGANVVQKY